METQLIVFTSPVCDFNVVANRGTTFVYRPFWAKRG